MRFFFICEQHKTGLMHTFTIIRYNAHMHTKKAKKKKKKKKNKADHRVHVNVFLMKFQIPKAAFPSCR